MTLLIKYFLFRPPTGVVEGFKVGGRKRKYLISNIKHSDKASTPRLRFIPSTTKVGMGRGLGMKEAGATSAISN